MEQMEIGSCLLDTSTVQTALALLVPGDDQYEGNSLSFLALQNFIEAIVLHEKIYIDDTVYSYPLVDELLQDLLPDKIVGYCTNTKALHEEALKLIRQHVQEVDTMIYFAAQGVGWEPPAEHLLNSLNAFDEKTLSDLHPGVGRRRWAIPSVHDIDKQIIFSEEHKEVIESVSGLGLSNLSTTVALTVYRTVRYLLISNASSIRYAPHPAREPVVMWWMDMDSEDKAEYFRLWTFGETWTDMDNEEKTENFRLWALDEIAKARGKPAKRAEKLVPAGTLEVEIPLVFSEVLRRSKDPSEIIKNAIKLRNTRYARSFRAWCNRVEDAVSKVEMLKVSEAVRAVEELRSILESSEIRTEKRLKLTLGFPPSIGVDVQVPRIGRTHIVFLRKLYESLGNVASHYQQIKRLFRYTPYL